LQRWHVEDGQLGEEEEGVGKGFDAKDRFRFRAAVPGLKKLKENHGAFDEESSLFKRPPEVGFSITQEVYKKTRGYSG